MEHTSLVPAWVKVLSPNVTKLELGRSTLADPPLRQPMPHPHLQHLKWYQPGDNPPLAQHVRQQLAALPSLTSLELWNLDWADEEEEEGQQQQQQQDAGRLISRSVTRLQLFDESLSETWKVQHLHTQFPCLRELVTDGTCVDDDCLEALLQALPHLERLSVDGFRLQRSHAHEAWPWRDFSARRLHVDSFARLPLDGIPACSWLWVVPSSDAAAVARVAQAVKRWGSARYLDIIGGDFTALLTTLGPMVAAQPAAQQRGLCISDLRDVTPQQLQQLGQHVPATVSMLCLRTYCLAMDTWSALLPSLPASVTALRLLPVSPPLTEQQVLALCQAAVRPIWVDLGSLNQEQLKHVRTILSLLAPTALVTLERAP